MNKSLLIFFAMLTLAGCASPTRTVQEGVKDPGPRVAARPLPAAERMTVGIARFTNESIYGSGLLLMLPVTVSESRHLICWPGT
jgi:hypothetical protein